MRDETRAARRSVLAGCAVRPALTSIQIIVSAPPVHRAFSRRSFPGRRATFWILGPWGRGHWSDPGTGRCLRAPRAAPDGQRLSRWRPTAERPEARVTRYGHQLTAAALARSLRSRRRAAGKRSPQSRRPPTRTSSSSNVLSRRRASLRELRPRALRHLRDRPRRRLRPQARGATRRARSRLLRATRRRLRLPRRVPSFPFPTGGAAAFASLVRNDVQGIGVALFDNGAAFGSDSRLGAIVDMGRLESWSTQPSEANF